MKRIITFTSLLALLCTPLFAAELSSGDDPHKSRIKRILQEIRMEEAAQTPAQKEARTVYDEGFTMVGEDDSLKIGAWMQNDVRVFFKGNPNRDQFLVRRARLDFRGSLENIFGFRVMGEFEGDNGTNAANLKEGWLEYNQFPAFRIKVGQFKEPFSLENLYGDLWLDFLERPMGTNFIRPEQDLGLMFFGKLFTQHLEYGVGIFNGSGTNVAENNDDKDVAARLAITPFATSTSRWANHLTLAGSVTYGKQSSTLDGTGPTTPGGTRFFTFDNSTAGNDVTVAATRLRYGADLEWIVGPFSLKGEFSRSRLPNVTFGGVARVWNLTGLHGQMTYVLTCEEKSTQKSVSPRHPFNPKEGHWGAVELAARGELVRADQGIIDAGFAAGTDDLWSVSGGVNWYLNRHVRWVTNYVYTRFNDAVAGAGAKNTEHALLTRIQFNL